MTNSSDVNFLHSYKALDVPKGEESKVIPAKKIGVPEKLNLNQSKSYINSDYVKEEDIPDQYKSHKEVPKIVHNLNNP